MKTECTVAILLVCALVMAQTFQDGAGLRREVVAAEVPAEEVILVDDTDPVLNAPIVAQDAAASEVSLSETADQSKGRRQRAGQPFNRPCTAGYKRSRRGCVLVTA
ncbi:uncharacterized protein LOC126284924 isoform X2 [Schistocerca gregaria]|uniref:uncharacterized protein LOC126284924 isoform X2 n=1 Tax=Schistocerca gregaria TaxID=7010 RepID=UPI00211E82B1|nr:uncharacterized protein LOC126284924 isoform X2 [Schistocerca gregaria]